MAADILSAAGCAVNIFEKMPTVGRKFLMAGKSGLNLTHSEDLQAFNSRYFEAADFMKRLLHAFGPAEVCRWADELGAETFVGSSGMVFPKAMKGSPLLRAWIARLKQQGCAFYPRHQFVGLDGSSVHLLGPQGSIVKSADAVILALGGATWPRLGSNADWVPLLTEKGVSCNEFEPSNCGFTVNWSPKMQTFFGKVVKNVRLLAGTASKKGDFVISAYGIEGSTVYRLSRDLRVALKASTRTSLLVDLMPDWSQGKIAKALGKPRGKKSLSTHLKRVLKLDAVKLALLYECVDSSVMSDISALSKAIKGLPVILEGMRPLEEAISSAGGVALSELDENLMLHKLPHVYVAGEMLDWEAPTGGYLLTACLSQGAWIARSILQR
ncbi:dehydrogenase [Kordiimonas sediminis]|uniref:Dehydrogenase n=2 Tax=Kordiimonas sediminis TaxID=1735581 RepID=A0A919AT49_9PROT|nr:dehydrogenase [Kordiimonas sediminis]